MPNSEWKHCAHCAAGLPMSFSREGFHWNGVGKELLPCGGPSSEEYIAKLETKLEEEQAVSFGRLRVLKEKAEELRSVWQRAEIAEAG